MPLEDHCLSFPGFLISYLFCGREWAKDLLLSGLVVGRLTSMLSIPNLLRVSDN